MIDWITLAAEGWSFAKAVFLILIVCCVVGCSGFSTKIPEPGYQIVQIVKQEKVKHERGE